MFWNKNSTRRKRFCNYFNLIEIAMALGIIGFGVTSVMAVIPAALKEVQTSIGEDYSSSAAELFLSYITLTAKSDASGWVTITGLPDAANPPIVDAVLDDFSTNDIDADNWPGIRAHNSDGSVFLVVSRSNSGNDFEAVVRMWTKQLPVSSTSVRSTTPSSYDSTAFSAITGGLPTTSAAGVFVELSWPAHKPYPVRDKRTYYLELFKPNL